MRTVNEARSRWQETMKHAGDVGDLVASVKYNGDGGPCVTGCRSVCWKAFLLFRGAALTDVVGQLSDLRHDYAQQSERLLRYIKHPELLAEATTDPLADDPDSPWNTVREDELVRGEIAQDVRRLPDEPFYHHERSQEMIIDVLFVYCKLNPQAGGYRQGMHELLAPVVYVMDQDAIDISSIDPESPDDKLMGTVLDQAFVEHDAFAIFAKIMENAQSFYEVNDSISKSVLSATTGREQTSAIVEKSKYIHEHCLAKVDPELAAHLKSIEILPQIFLIRWIRLLFGREFPFDQLLVLWDTLFAVDPSLALVDLICVAMLIRIRWKLLEADYSVCLQLLLKYPSPDAPHGPHTFVDDALYLKGHLHASGGASLILKYTGKMPSSSSGSRPVTPNAQALGLRAARARALPSPSRFIQQQGGVEALLQGAAKRVYERGENLGINQAVRDAVGEIRRNVQGFQEARMSPRVPHEASSSSLSLRGGRATFERRNRQLARMLDESVSALQGLAASADLEGRDGARELVQMAAAKVQFVQVYLEDSSLEMPGAEERPAAVGSPGREKHEDVVMSPGGGVSDTPTGQVAGAPAEDTAAMAIEKLSIKDSKPADKKPLPASPDHSAADAMDTSEDGASVTTSNAQTLIDPVHEPSPPKRPTAPIPTRSTLAQSSFSWMLEPDTTSPAGATPSFASSARHRSSLGAPQASSSPSVLPRGSSHRNRGSASASSREKNAFLFGEVTAETDEGRGVTRDDIFGLQPLSKGGGSSSSKR